MDVQNLSVDEMTKYVARFNDLRGSRDSTLMTISRGISALKLI